MNAKPLSIQTMYSDLYKEVSGFRPFYEDMTGWTEEDFKREYSEILKLLETPEEKAIRLMGEYASLDIGFNERTVRADMIELGQRLFGSWIKTPRYLRNYAFDIERHVTWGAPLQLQLT